ncbi:uncharacterized protein F5147DRAFT_781513 [Suillus discolor]|uniref:Crinkler effector protein N-terminal domain-containing protein n=1 Tax=Suillus discolor TaxID=1912936 RepID=A0A9P7JLC1_9AGAM|nr:uncharacterized protein F5147DRAFT_781513 [Suillus discolor]KAG2086817.1 hypothetical protein F5147DRAFT_781513 [Suillus discolor]
MSGLLHLKLNCIVLGDDPCHIFPVNVERTKTVGDLRNVIKDAKKPEFDHVAADRLELWKVKINLNDTNFCNAIIDEGVELHPLTKLSDVFVDGIERGCIHIVVRHPAVARHIPAVDRRITYQEGRGVTLTVGRRVRTRIGLLSDGSSEPTEAEGGSRLDRMSRVPPVISVRRRSSRYRASGYVLSRKGAT